MADVTTTLITGATLDGATVDVRFDTHIRDIAPRLSVQPRDRVIEADGGALLPGLHDHHMHFRALAAARSSIVCGPPAVTDEASLVDALAGADGTGWIRGVGYHESVAGELDRHWLDTHGPQRPLRIQHASGKCWMLNSLAMDAVTDGEGLPEGAERDAHGRLTGRLFRMDEWLRSRLPADDATGAARDLAMELARYGITGFTDTSAGNDEHARAWFEHMSERAVVPQRVMLMGNDSLRRGHLKVILDEDRLPALDDIVRRARAARVASRPLAFHCVTQAEMVFAAAVIDAVTPHPQDRIEHAALADEDALALLVRLGVTVVTQPGFIATRGDRYRRDVGTPEDLYRYGSLLRAGIPVACSSDAPYGPVDPWRVMHAAVHRIAPDGDVLGEKERVTPDTALRAYLSLPAQPGGPARRLTVGAPADLCLLERRWPDLRATLMRPAYAGAPVVRTFVRGYLVSGSDHASGA